MIEGGEGFVQEDQLAIHGHGDRKGDELLFTTGQVCRQVICTITQSHAIQCCQRTAIGIFRMLSGNNQWQRHIFCHATIR